jgi:hypothetical protein
LRIAARDWRLVSLTPAGFDKPASEAKIGFRRGWIARRMIMHQNKTIGGMENDRLKNLARVGERLVEDALCDRRRR